MQCASGWLWTGEGFEEGHVVVEDGIITQIVRGWSRYADFKGIILPTLFNAHVHTGDGFIRPLEGMRLEEIVAPPDGLKHRMLRETPPSQVLESMKHTLRAMQSSGTCHFADFREGGLKGVEMLERAVSEVGFSGTSLKLARPSGSDFDDRDIDALLSRADGIGISGIGDWEYSQLESMARRTHAAGKLLGIHASEGLREDVDAVLDLEPDFLVHMIHASDGDLELCADRGVAIAVCPRANAYFGLRAPVERMLALGVDVMLGTDNAMLASPSILEEMQHAAAMFKDLDAVDILKMAVQVPRKVLNADVNSMPAIGCPSDLLVFEMDTQKPGNAILGQECGDKLCLALAGSVADDGEKE